MSSQASNEVLLQGGGRAGQGFHINDAVGWEAHGQGSVVVTAGNRIKKSFQIDLNPKCKYKTRKLKK